MTRWTIDPAPSSLTFRIEQPGSVEVQSSLEYLPLIPDIFKFEEDLEITFKSSGVVQCDSDEEHF